MSYCGNIKNRVEYLTIIKTPSGECDIGVSYKYNPTDNSIFISGFHIDKGSILEQHQLAMPYEHNVNCHCLDSWNDDTIITHLTIGDKHIERQLKDMEEKLKALTKLKEALSTSGSILNQLQQFSASSAPVTPKIPLIPATPMSLFAAISQSAPISLV